MSVRNASAILLWLALAAHPFLAAPPTWPPKGKPRQTDLCSVVKRPRYFNDKYVEVSGVSRFRSGAVSNPKCRGMVTDGYAWPPGLYMALDRMSDSRVRGYQDALSRGFEVARAAGKDVICLTLIGVVESKRKYQVVTLPDGRKHGDGFGHLNVWPAKLHIVEVVSIETCPDPR